jgi:hypothetical protein
VSQKIGNSISNVFSYDLLQDKEMFTRFILTLHCAHFASKGWLLSEMKESFESMENETRSFRFENTRGFVFSLTYSAVFVVYCNRRSLVFRCLVL